MAMSPYDINKPPGKKRWYHEVFAAIVVPPVLVAFLVAQVFNTKKR